jgi:hypothetical protein
VRDASTSLAIGQRVDHFLNLPNELLAALERQEQGCGELSIAEISAIDHALRERLMLARVWRQHRESQGEVIEAEEPEMPKGLQTTEEQI